MCVIGVSFIGDWARRGDACWLIGGMKWRGAAVGTAGQGAGGKRASSTGGLSQAAAATILLTAAAHSSLVCAGSSQVCRAAVEVTSQGWLFVDAAAAQAATKYPKICRETLGW